MYVISEVSISKVFTSIVVVTRIINSLLYQLTTGGRRRKRRESPAKVDIPENWLAYLLGTRYRQPGNTKGGSVTVPLTPCLTGLESVV